MLQRGRVKNVVVAFLLNEFLFYRFGNLKNGIKDIKEHPWFKDTNFVALLNYEKASPFTPKIKSAGDASNFDPVQEIYRVNSSEKCLYEKEFAEF